MKSAFQRIYNMSQQHTIIMNASQNIKFYCMEQPIARRVHRNPRDFVIGSPQKKKAVNLYTFNPTSSRYDSGDKSHLDLTDPNPENMLSQSQPAPHPKIYFDAEAQKQKPEQLELNCKKPEVSQISSNSKYLNFGSFEDKIYSPQQKHRTSQQQQRLEKAMSGFIIKQKLKNKSALDLQSQQRNHTTQRQFNRLALSLMGVKRTKYNRSPFQKKNSFNFHPTANSRTLKQQRYPNNSAEEIGQIYKYSMYPFTVKKIDNIKEEVNRISGESRLRRNPHEKQTEAKLTFENKQQQESNKFAQIYAQSDWQVKVTIKTSLSALKNLLSSGTETNQIYIEVPSFFYKPPSQFKKINNFNTEILTNQCTHIFSSLQIPITNINIRKYSNCAVIVNSSICIVWHEGRDGKRYIGSWQNKYFDEGEKEGLGLEWAPGRYVYYGQFKSNKRDGFGVMRKNDETVIVGYWRRGKHQQFGIEKNYA